MTVSPLPRETGLWTWLGGWEASLLCSRPSLPLLSSLTRRSEVSGSRDILPVISLNTTNNLTDISLYIPVLFQSHQHDLARQLGGV